MADVWEICVQLRFQLHHVLYKDMWDRTRSTGRMWAKGCFIHSEVAALIFFKKNLFLLFWPLVLFPKLTNAGDDVVVFYNDKASLVHMLEMMTTARDGIEENSPLKYHISLVDLLAACAEGKNVYTEIKCTSLLPLEDVVRVVTHDDCITEVMARGRQLNWRLWFFSYHEMVLLPCLMLCVLWRKRRLWGQWGWWTGCASTAHWWVGSTNGSTDCNIKESVKSFEGAFLSSTFFSHVGQVPSACHLPFRWRWLM